MHLFTIAHLFQMQIIRGLQLLPMMQKNILSIYPPLLRSKACTIDNHQKEKYMFKCNRKFDKLNTISSSSLLLGNTNTNNNNGESQIYLQSDTSMFGRGDMHLSAMINEGDVVMYQIGTWEVDGVIVGNDDNEKSERKYCKVDTMQVVWTHNCEHGVIRGMSCDIVNDDAIDDVVVKVTDPLEFVEFGPEQLVAQLPVQWNADDEDIGSLLVPFPENLM